MPTKYKVTFSGDTEQEMWDAAISATSKHIQSLAKQALPPNIKVGQVVVDPSAASPLAPPQPVLSGPALSGQSASVEQPGVIPPGKMPNERTDLKAMEAMHGVRK